MLLLASATSLLALGAPRPIPFAVNPSGEMRMPIGISQGLVCDSDYSDVLWRVDPESGYRYVTSNSIPAFPVLDYCPFGMGGLYCGAYKSCPSGLWGEAGELCVPDGSGIVLDPNRPGSDWGVIATDVEDCPNPTWETTTCPQNEDWDGGDCLAIHNIDCRLPLAPLPVSRDDGPQKYNRVHGVGIDGITIQGPREAGGLSLEEANIVKDECEGHCTPGMNDARYHYHMSPQCAFSTNNTAGGTILWSTEAFSLSLFSVGNIVSAVNFLPCTLCLGSRSRSVLWQSTTRRRPPRIRRSWRGSSTASGSTATRTPAARARTAP